MVLRGERWGWLCPARRYRVVEHHGLCRWTRHRRHRHHPLLGARRRAKSRGSRAVVSRLLLGDISGDAFVSRALRIGRDFREHALVVIFVCRERIHDREFR